MKFLLAKKQKMTQVFSDEGKVIPVTVLSANPSVVTQVKTKERDGYIAVQLGFGVRKEKRIPKPERGHFKGLGNFAQVKEFSSRGEPMELNVGDKIDVSIFSPGDTVAVSAISKGKGFQGVVRRHGFAGGSRTHGQKHSEREPGSIGGGLRTRVPKGMRMAGRMGGERVTVKNLTVVQVDPEQNLLLVGGAVPGRKGTLVEIRSTKRETQKNS
ncbi:50S ribosomal protein L3 [Patescibacteria group bacterium]|nr:MAG: 50S ribosomal protein L3 [Patescibacteria group bacterium]